MAKIPKKKKAPKAPKESASIEVWRNYKKKKQEICKHNKNVQKLIDAEKKQKEALKKEKAAIRAMRVC